jgi:urea carboxylase-associated protein 1
VAGRAASISRRRRTADRGVDMTETRHNAILEDRVVPAREEWSRVLAPGQILRITDLEGHQAVDFLCYNAKDPAERYNAADTMKINGSIFIGQGSKLYSDMGNALFTVVADSCGRHDTIGGCCSNEANRVRYGATDGPNCRDNFIRALGRHGLGKKDIVANINFFMHVPVGADGFMNTGLDAGHSKPGDRVELRAEMEVLAVLSNCPQINNATNDFNPTPVRVTVFERD